MNSFTKFIGKTKNQSIQRYYTFDEKEILDYEWIMLLFDKSYELFYHKINCWIYLRIHKTIELILSPW